MSTACLARRADMSPAIASVAITSTVVMLPREGRRVLKEESMLSQDLIDEQQ
jgi:hypothetical protein